jgi:succinate--hydroxymethylglutarate CoA-transferase
MELVEKCDVLIENYIPGKLSQIGIEYENIKKINPSIIYASITGFGSSGPYAKRAGYDVIAASIGGLLSITGPEDGDPCKPGVAVTDLTTGLYMKSAILSALLYRERFGTGCKIDCNLLSSQVSMLTNLASNYLNCGAKARRRGTAHESIVPYQSFKCKDSKYITIGAASDRMFAKLCQLIDLREASNDKRFQNNAKRVENRNELIELIQQKIQIKPISDWLNIFDNSGISYGPVNDIEDVFVDKQILHNNCVIETNDPKTGNIKMLANAVKYESDYNMLNTSFTSPPLLGQHTSEILKSVLGYDDSKIKLLLDQNVIECHS